MDFRIRQLQCFLVLAEKLNYGKAARSQFMTQPTLSFQIKSLEEDCGTRLFDRSHQGVKLTAAGERLVLSARRILAEVASVHKQISGLETQAPLRVCCSQAGQFDILPKLLRNLTKADPMFSLELQPMVPEERVQSLTSGKLDALMMVAPVEAPGITFQLLRSETIIAVVPEIPPFTSMTRISMHELAKNPVLVANEKDCSHCKQFTLGLYSRLGITPRTIETPINLNVVFAMIAAGMGVGTTSESLLGTKFPGVIFLPIKESMPKSKLGVAWRTDDDSPSLALFREQLIETVSSCSAYQESANAGHFPDLPAIASAM